MSSTSKIWQEIKERFEFCIILALLCGCGYLTWYQLIWIVFMLIFGGISAAMIPLYDIAEKKLNETKNMNELELDKFRQVLQEADKIIADYQVETIITDYKKIKKINRLKIAITHNIEVANQEYDKKKRQQKKREKDIENERRKLGFTCGVPPNNDKCPKEFPIVVTGNLSKDDPYRGIYYRPGDKKYNSNPYWCFKNENEAISNNCRRPKKPGRKKT